MIDEKIVAEWIYDTFGDTNYFEDKLCPLCAYRKENCVENDRECVDGIAKELEKIKIKHLLQKSEIVLNAGKGGV